MPKKRLNFSKGECWSIRLNVRFATSPNDRLLAPIVCSEFSNASYSLSGTKHVVLMKWAWKRGAEYWPPAKREKFANDPANLWPLELGLNRSKIARGPNHWLPPLARCQYVARFNRLVKRYDLTPKPSERQWLRDFIGSCR